MTFRKTSMKNKFPTISKVEKEYGEKAATIMLTYLHTYIHEIRPCRKDVPEYVFGPVLKKLISNMCDDLGKENLMNSLHFSIFYFSDPQLHKELAACGKKYVLPEMELAKSLARLLLKRQLSSDINKSTRF